MSTNFFWLDTSRDRYDPIHHIGKRSSAGLYCWDCDVKLLSRPQLRPVFACPQCGKERTTERFDEDSGGRELGLAKGPVVRPTGVRSAAIFIWAQTAMSVRRRCEARQDEEPIIENEYGERLTGTEFLTMLQNECPLNDESAVGEWFS